MSKNLTQHNQRVNVSHFSMQQRADIPRSTFRIDHSHKTTIAGNYLYPIFVDEVLPGDSLKGRLTIFARMATLIFPLMDTVSLETFFFFVPNRLVWDNWHKFMGERTPNTSSSISYTIPQVVSPVGGFLANDVFDHMGLPTVGQVDPAEAITANALPLRGWNLIYNEWFRDENLINQVPFVTGDGPDSSGIYDLWLRAKKRDYFTSALPWPQKNPGGVLDPGVPLSGLAPVRGLGTPVGVAPSGGATNINTSDGVWGYANAYTTGVTALFSGALDNSVSAVPQIFANLTGGGQVAIAAIRLAFQTQKFLERDARGGTRYTELLQSHFGVMPEDFRLQRPEYIGGGTSDMMTQAIPQTAPEAGASGPLASLGGAATITGQHHFSYQAKEHGYIIGMVNVSQGISYQQGLRRMWTRQTRYDFYWPVFAHLGEQPIRQDEIFADGTVADLATFGYQERWAEYKYHPNIITGFFKSTTTGNIDEWHLAEEFGTAPALNSTFINQQNNFDRVLAAGGLAAGLQFYLDMLFNLTYTRPMPMYSTPGLADHF